MPTEAEWMAIMACAVKAHNAYGTRYDTANQYATVTHWGKKWLEQRNKCRERASAWNKTHKKRHCELNKQSYARKKNAKIIAKKQLTNKEI